MTLERECPSFLLILFFQHSRHINTITTPPACAMPPPPPARIELAQLSTAAWGTSTVAPLPASTPCSSAPPTNAALNTKSPTRRRSVTPSSAMAQDTTGGAPTILEDFLQRLRKADKAIPTLLLCAGRRRARKTFASLTEWRESRRMDHLLQRIGTALRDATWRWKLVQSFVMRDDFISGYEPPRRMVYATIPYKSRLPPPAPTAPRASDLQQMDPGVALQKLVAFKDAVGTYLRTVWVPDEEEHVPRALAQVRSLSERRTCALLGLPQDVIAHSRLGSTIHMNKALLVKADQMLLDRERGMSGQWIRRQFVVPVAEREDMDPTLRLERMRKYGWQVREQLFLPSALEDVEGLDEAIDRTIAQLTPREKAKSVLLEVPDIERVVAQQAPNVLSSWLASDNSSSSSCGRSPWRGRVHATDSRRQPEEHLGVVDFSFCRLTSMHEVLLAQPRNQVLCPTGQRTPTATPGRASTPGVAASPQRRGSLRRGKSFAVDRLHQSRAEAEALHKLSLYVFNEKDDNPVLLQQRLMSTMQQGMSPSLLRKSSLSLRHGVQSGTGAVRRASGESGGGATSPRKLTEKHDLVARRGVAPDLLAYVDHPNVGAYLALGAHHQVRPDVHRKRFEHAAMHILKLNDNQLGAPVATVSPDHRVLAPEDPRRGTRADPDVVLWKQLHNAAQPTLDDSNGMHHHRAAPNCVIDGMRYAALFLKCLVPTGLETVVTLDLSGNVLAAVPVVLVQQMPVLRHLKLHRNCIASLVSVAEACGLCGPSPNTVDGTAGYGSPIRPHSSNSATPGSTTHHRRATRANGPVTISPKEYGTHRSERSIAASLRRSLTSLTMHGNPVQEQDGVLYRRFLLICFPWLTTLDFGTILERDVDEVWQAGGSFVLR